MLSLAFLANVRRPHIGCRIERYFINDVPHPGTKQITTCWTVMLRSTHRERTENRQLENTLGQSNNQKLNLIMCWEMGETGGGKN